MNFQDLLTALKVRELHGDPSVKTSRTEKRRVEGIRAVGRRQDHNALGTVETVHLGEKLVQSLLSLVVASGKARSVTLLTDRIDLVDKYDTGSFLIGLLEEVTYLGCSHTYEHFHKFRTGNGEEGNLRLSGNRFRQKCLTCSGRSYKKRAFGHGCADLGIFLRIMEI